MRTRLVALAGCAALVAPVALGTVGTANAAPAENPPVRLVGGVTSPVYDYPTAIRETVWVTTPDLDGDGAPERVAADIIRPRELDGTARVPVIMDASPYYLSLGRGNESEFKEYDAQGIPIKFPLYYDNYFVPRGYAFVAVDMAGTARSTGCSDEGGRSDVESVKAVIEWLDGKGVAHDASGQVVDADWSNGKTGMIGKSYDGTLANGVAAAGVDGLRTIVPISAISSWYDYNRWQGAVKSFNYPSGLSRTIARNRTIATDCSPRLSWMDANDGDETGAYTDFWAERDYREGTYYDASKVKASVFIVHGLQDNNVKTMNASKWWQDLGRQGVTRKMWLTRLGHVDPFDSDREAWVSTLHRWFDHELMGVRNGITREPAVRVETAPTHWVTSRWWPTPAAWTARLNFHSDGTMMRGLKDRSTASYVNDWRLSENTAVQLGDNPNRLLFLTGSTKREVRVSGTPTVDLDVTHGSPVGQVSVMLVDYGQMDRVSASGDGAETLSTESCWGPASADDDACYLDVARRIGSTNLQVLARGWARLDGAGRQKVTVELAANDVLVPAGHQLGVVISGSRNGVVAVDTAATTYTIGLRGSRLNLPVAGVLTGFGPGRMTVKDTQNLRPGTLANLNATRWPGN
ncbi:MAG: CocE/NonD family hydrolase [Intrasporangium sp.]|uniref:CocE/NonD family hydrolase n=1 Tax=Intrasporangium sp. TaxID=1925024 RepID=UPI002648295A|nr:CocE/NonD family hydrolase [Intrasporangium sp.]MDN5796248.1 CocE/NonD family hydrolase [Intrasporangium sp.]